jgi:hypothetical protein
MRTRGRCAFAILAVAAGCSHAGLPSGVDDPALSECPAAAAASTSATPAQLTSGQLNPSDIAVDAEQIYWINAGTARLVSDEQADPNPDGALMAVAKSGGDPRALATGLRGPANLTLGASAVYVSTADGTILAVAKQAASAPLTVATGQSPVAIAADATRIYWANNDGSIQAAPVGGGPAVVLASGERPFALVADRDTLYWSTGDDTLHALAKSGGTPSSLLGGAGTAVHLAVCRGRLYFDTALSRVLGSVSTSGDAATTFATAINVQGIAVDQGDLFVSRLEGGVQAWPTAPAGAAHTLVSHQPGTRAIAVDDARVYWIAATTAQDGQIWSRAK